HPCGLRAGVVDSAGLEQGEREVVACLVMRRIDRAGPLEVGEGRPQLLLLEIERGELIPRLEAVGMVARRLDEPPLEGERASGRGLCGSGPCSREDERQREQEREATSYQYSLAPSCTCRGVLRMLVMLAKLRASLKFSEPGRLNAAVLVTL